MPEPEPEPEPQELHQLVKPGRYVIPKALSATEVGFETGKERPHVRLLLADGYELDIPLTQQAVDTLDLILAPFRSHQ